MKFRFQIKEILKIFDSFLNSPWGGLSNSIMKRKPVICSLILLPLWLVAVAGDLITFPADGGVINSSQTAVFKPIGPSNNGSGSDLIPFKHFPQHMIRRPVTFGGADSGLAFSSGDAAISFTGITPDISGFTVVTSPADLVCGWQFHLRAASQPRAPSLVS